MDNSNVKTQDDKNAQIGILSMVAIVVLSAAALYYLGHDSEALVNHPAPTETAANHNPH